MASPPSVPAWQMRDGADDCSMRNAQTGSGAMEKRTRFWWTNMYTLVYLRDLGVDPESDRTRRAIDLVQANVTWGPWHGYSPFFEGEEEPCINGRVVALGAYFGKPSLRLVDLLLSEQLEDGGWNCEALNGSVRSSFHTTICVLEGLLAHERAFGKDPAITEARKRGGEYLLERHLLRRLSTGDVIDEGWRRLAYPPLWHYDVLRGLEYAVNAGFEGDPRLTEAIETVESRQLPDGRWCLRRAAQGHPLRGDRRCSRRTEPMDHAPRTPRAEALAPMMGPQRPAATAYDILEMWPTMAPMRVRLRSLLKRYSLIGRSYVCII